MIFKSVTAATLLAFAISLLQAQIAPQVTPPKSATSTAPTSLMDPPAAQPQTTPFKEDWTSISLKQSGLPAGPVDGTELSKVELAEGCTRELVQMEWRPVDPIDVYVIRPNDVPKPPVGIFLLNYTFDSAVFRNDYWCTQAKQNHLAIVGFGSMLSVQRFHAPRLMKQWFVSELPEALATSTHDVQMVLNYLESRKDLDGHRVGLYGQGSGGAIGILAAAADPRIGVLQVVDPWGDWPDWLKGSKQIPEDERETYLTPDFLKQVDHLDPITYLPHLALRSLRIQQVAADTVTPTEAKKKIAAAARAPEDVVRYPDNEAQHKTVFLGGITEWLAQRLAEPTLSVTAWATAE